jgi:hypothetical protein
MQETNINEKSISQYHSVMNQKLYNRNVPSQMLQPYLNVAPVSTKYSVLPIVDVRKQQRTPFIQQPTYNLSDTFNPGSNHGPWSGYSQKINDESVLRNQVYALQRGSQSDYIPSSGSDLYSSPISENTVAPTQFPYLFRNDINATNKNVLPEHHDVHHTIFSNHTRQQLDMFQHQK